MTAGRWRTWVCSMPAVPAPNAYVSDDVPVRARLDGVEIRCLEHAFDDRIRVVRMNTRRVGCKRGVCIDHRRQFVKFKLDAIGDILGFACA